MREISIRDARRVGLHRQGLLQSGCFGRGKNAVVRVVEQLGYVQIDTFSVVDRAHHHVLKTRVPNYAEHMLDHLVRRDKKLFEYWAHAAAYLPLAEYRYYRPTMDAFERSRKQDLDGRAAAHVMARIRAEGPLQSRDFDPPDGRRSNGWWDWKPAKRALENLFLSGKLMIAYREGFQKVFDLTENVLPGDVDTTMPTPEEWYRFLVLRAIRGHGIATAPNILTACRGVGNLVRQPLREGLLTAIDQLVSDGPLEPLLCGGQTWYTLPGALDELPTRLAPKRVRFLSPFDHAVIDRRRTLELFGFDYQIECYLPQAKRTYGYFCLPILWGDEFIGRMDAKAVRAAGRFEVRGLYLEQHVKLNNHLQEALNDAMQLLAEAHGCPTLEAAPIR